MTRSQEVRTLRILEILRISHSIHLVEYSDIIEGGLVETDPGYFNNYYADQNYAQYYQK